MISCKCNFDSMVLGTRMHVDVYLPHPINYMRTVADYKKEYDFKPFKTLYLFHGAWNSGEQWIENTSIIRYAEEAGMAVVILYAGNSFYINANDGKRFEDFVVKELISMVRGVFPLSEKKEDNFACGMSMGGYGIFNIAFKYPDIFNKCAMMSPVVDISFSIRFLKTLGLPSEGVFGKWKEARGSRMDLKVVLEDNIKNKDKFPEMLIIYGDSDDLAPGISEYADFVKEHGVDIECRNYPGDHTWSFWDEHTKECMDFFKKH